MSFSLSYTDRSGFANLQPGGADLEIPIDSRIMPAAVRQILDRLDQAGFETWLVGGCVRDLCLGLAPKDYDLATSARPEQVQQIFPHSFATGLQHGTVTVIWQSLAVEITTFRTEGPYSDSRRPDLVFFQDQIEADLARRDFTMNSMAWRPDRGLLDPHGGLSDLQQGLLRSVGDPAGRFDEDALRLLRAVRFAVTYDLTPDPDLVLAAGRMASRLRRLSRERVAGEMLRILASPYPLQLRSFGGCGILAEAVSLLLKLETDDQQLCANLSRLIQAELRPAQRMPLLFLVAVAPDLDPAVLRRTLLAAFHPAAENHLQQLLMKECRLSRHLAQSCEAILYLILLRLLLPVQNPLGIVSQRRLLRLLARRCHLEIKELAESATMSTQLMRLILADYRRQPEADCWNFQPDAAATPPLTLSGLALNGRQLQLAGWKSGPDMRKLLERLLSWVLDTPALNRPADLMAMTGALGVRRPDRHTNDKNMSCLPAKDL